MTLTTRLSLFFLAALAAVLVTFSAALYLAAGGRGVTVARGDGAAGDEPRVALSGQCDVRE